jgi:hypothetical protein
MNLLSDASPKSRREAKPVESKFFGFALAVDCQPLHPLLSARTSLDVTVFVNTRQNSLSSSDPLPFGISVIVTLLVLKSIVSFPVTQSRAEVCATNPLASHFVIV